MNLREYLPLEQGLRPTMLNNEINTKFLREYLPLEQGLRRYKCLQIRVSVATQRVSSIRTRIKTTCSIENAISVSISESIFH